MRQTLIITLMATHLFGNTELAQVFRLPKLVSHYLQHKRSNHSLTFAAFLDMHYGGDDGTSKDDDIDSQLPYHHTDYHCLFGTYYPLHQYTLTIKSSEPISDYEDQLVLDNLSKHVSLILQPPRQV